MTKLSETQSRWYCIVCASGHFRLMTHSGGHITFTKYSRNSSKSGHKNVLDSIGY